jgi:hypothetical protein
MVSLDCQSPDNGDTIGALVFLMCLDWLLGAQPKCTSGGIFPLFALSFPKKKKDAAPIGASENTLFKSELKKPSLLVRLEKPKVYREAHNRVVFLLKGSRYIFYFTVMHKKHPN